MADKGVTRHDDEAWPLLEIWQVYSVVQVYGVPLHRNFLILAALITQLKCSALLWLTASPDLSAYSVCTISDPSHPTTSSVSLPNKHALA